MLQNVNISLSNINGCPTDGAKPGTEQRLEVSVVVVLVRFSILLLL